MRSGSTTRLTRQFNHVHNGRCTDIRAPNIVWSTRRQNVPNETASRQMAHADTRFVAASRSVGIVTLTVTLAVLVQPATVDRWHRAGLRRCWRRRSRHPGRPRIDSTCRDLIRRLATENHLWGAPRIHGELLKLGIAVSERTVSRYLQGRPTARSQTWRTFFANHLGDVAFMPPVMSSSAPDDDVVDASGLSCCPVRSCFDGLSQPINRRSSTGLDRIDTRFLGRRLVQDYDCDPTSALNQTCCEQEL
jgi:hypothetical protein